MLFIEKVDFTSDEYLESLKLREEILRKPIGLKISKEQLDNEKNNNHYHFIAKQSKKVISALTMKINPNSIQTCQIATDENYRGNGIGEKLLYFGEEYILSFIKKKEFVVFSRLTSLSFYKNCSYEFKNDRIYIINGIEHRLLKKTCGNNVYSS